MTVADLDDLVALDSDPLVMQFLGNGRPTPRAVIETEVLPTFLSYDLRGPGLGFWAADEIATGTFVGWFALRPTADHDPAEVELGYRLRRDVWGRGYATEASRALIDRGFAENGVQRVFAQTMAVNLGSRRVMEKVGLVHVRTFHEYFPEPLPGAEHGEVEYALDRADWERGWQDASHA